MPPTLLRAAAYCTYLAAWLVFAVGATLGAIPALHRHTAVASRITAPVAIGALLQVASAMALTLSMPAGPLRPTTAHLIAVLALAPLGAALFVWSLRSVPKDAGAETLVTTGAYAVLRHPIYLAFLAMLLATGLLVTNLPRLAIAILIYLAGTEMRIAEEERDLSERHGDEFEAYRRRTRARYLPGLR